ncbi:MAG: gluconeogenesis factor YvcK family protein [Elusimicrobiota bacterium]
MKQFSDLNIVAIGGGTGISTLLSGLKAYNKNLSAIVTVTDDGGSSGRLSREYGILPPGDIRNCLVSLAEEETLMSQLFQYRFGGEGDIAGHSFGNLFIMAMSDIRGGFEKGIVESSKILAIDGKVIPATLHKVALRAKLETEEVLKGETAISKSVGRIKSIFLEPSECKAVPEAVESMNNADIIILGPGSLYTSVIPNLLINDINKALRNSKALKVFVCNIMSQPGETNNFSSLDHLQALNDHIGASCIDYILINTKRIDEDLLEKYAKKASYPIAYDSANVFGNTAYVTGDFFGRQMSESAKYARHDPKKLSSAIVDLYHSKYKELNRLSF